ncbi:MAG: hypothetical protein MPJ50_01675 [Pirellulales bacterium]|nr:hypothetical protein [Pirellulales bacterium]
MSIAESYAPTTKAQSLVDSLGPEKYDRQITAGLTKLVKGEAPTDLQSLYSADELIALEGVKGSERDVEARMPVKITEHYLQLAKRSKPIQKLVKADPNETLDMQGAPDPGNQMDYSPIEGMIHKYELALLYVVSTCSAHCRFCYREELIARKEVTRPDGTVAPKGLAQIPEVVEYIRNHNREVESNGGRHPETGRERLREILMSGGDPMVLTNRKMASWWAALSDAGIDSIRIGTKELAFFPGRFDDAFFDMMHKFHESYPRTALRFMVHFNHPDEFLQKDENGQFIEHPEGGFVWVEQTERSVKRLAACDWVNIDNQSPIIKGINDDPDALRIMQRELKRNRVENHYFFCGRDIVGYKAFNVPIETTWQILNDSQKGLSGVEAHARLSITHYKGKTEVNSVTNKPIPGLRGAENGVVIFKLLRSVEDAPDRGKVTIVGRNPDALWFDGYADRVIYDEAGLYPDSKLISQD